MKAWRESASLIIAARNGLKHNQSYDYNLLFLKRHRTQRFAGAFVFPGGLIEPADADLKWHIIFKNHGYNENSFKFLFPSTKNRPEIFRSKENELPREISLRISAIRETFEECGILICKKSSESITDSEETHHFKFANGELEFWQDKVHADANEFYNMCERLQCYPNLWALHEWGNWLTPTFFPQRYNTAFFIVCLPEMPDSKIECTEMEELLWTTPEQMLASFKDDLMPPQQYEVLRIAKYKRIDDLLEVALHCSKTGIQQYLPVRVMLSDGSVHLLPEDPMYPEKVELYKPELLDRSNITIKQFRHTSVKMNRMEFFNRLEDGDTASSKL